MKKKVSIFGSTGSIGESTLNVIRENKDKFEIITLVAGKNIQNLINQIKEFHPKNVYIISEGNATTLEHLFPQLNIYYGETGMEEISQLTDFDICVLALVGISGLKPAYNMLKNGKTVALANKEVLVAGGKVIMEIAQKSNASILTIDSEHSAIVQCLNGEGKEQIDKILLTASGGPFLDKNIDESITPQDALNHPTWKMGKKVTVDSATMMNKGFEVIEAKWLFDVDPSQIQVVIHRNSIVHSMVQFKDGTIMANLGPKSMQIPIAYALNCYDRLTNNINKIDLFEIKQLTFERPDFDKFECLKLAYESIEKGHSYQVVLNAADEVLVDAFLNGKIPFPQIPSGIKKMLVQHKGVQLQSIDDILKLDKITKEETKTLIDSIK